MFYLLHWANEKIYLMNKYKTGCSKVIGFSVQTLHFIFGVAMLFNNSNAKTYMYIKLGKPSKVK